jgi:hypothetical protein
MMASDPLSVESILSHMAEALPTHEKGDTTSDFSSSYEAIALFAHACMTAVGFRLLGFTEGQKIGKLALLPRTSISTSILLTATPSESELAAVSPRLSPRWNDSYGSYSFLYAHSQSSLQYIIKIDRLGGKAEIRGLGLGDERITRFEIVAKDYISSSALPLRIPFTADGEEDRASLPLKLKEIFISESRIKDLASLFKTTVIQKLVPGLHKEGYEESEAAASARQQAQDAREDAYARRHPGADPLADPGLPEPARPHPYPLHDPLAPPPRRPVPDFPPPGFEDEYELQRPPRGMGAPYGGRSPYGIGGDDLNPPGLGPHDPLRGSFVPGGLGRPGGFGGMHPTFDDPLFAGRRGRGGGNGGFDPQAPEGARWDPIGPGEGPRDRMGRCGGGFPGGGGGNQGTGGNGRPPNPFGGYESGDFI